MATVLKVGGKEVALSNIDKQWWPQEGISKGDVINYYIEIAPWLLPHLHHRPLVLTRYPNGWQGKSFYQKNTPTSAPPWLSTYSLATKNRVVNYCLVDDLASLLWVVNSGGFEIHPFLSRVQHIENPDFLVIDIDPAKDSSWHHVCETALLVKTALAAWGLTGYPKLSGATGIQIFVPILPNYSYRQTRQITFLLLQQVKSKLSHFTTLERSISKREGKIYLDYLQNSLGKTLAVVYGLRPQAGATVSAPIGWDEVKTMDHQPHMYTLGNMKERIINKGELFEDVLVNKQGLDHLLPLLQQDI